MSASHTPGVGPAKIVRKVHDDVGLCCRCTQGFSRNNKGACKEQHGACWSHGVVVLSRCEIRDVNAHTHSDTNTHTGHTHPQMTLVKKDHYTGWRRVFISKNIQLC